MIRFDEWWFPDGERHLPEWMRRVNRRVDGRLTYQYGKYETALEFVRPRRVAIDIGAHVGLWSYFMARDFDLVFAIEPVEAHAACWVRNLQSRSNASLHRAALGDREGEVVMRSPRPDSSGDTGVHVNGAGVPVRQTQLDIFGFKNVDFIKVDCEGYELFALRGAVETIRRCRPVIIVEQKAGHGRRYGLSDTEGVSFLQGLGMKQIGAPLSGDYVMGW